MALSQAGLWFDEDILKRRASFRGRVNEPSVLAIANMSLSDQAVYRCRVDFREAKSRNARINLTVIGNAFDGINDLLHHVYCTQSCTAIKNCSWVVPE